MFTRSALKEGKVRSAADAREAIEVARKLVAKANDWYDRNEVLDETLGYRLMKAGKRLALVADVQPATVE